MKVFRAISEPVRKDPTFDERWGSIELGLITSWEAGREMGLEKPELVEDAKVGRLMVLPWKGGVAKALKTTTKYGVFNYVAMWQGLRGENLNVDPEVEMTMTCTVMNVTVTYTSDFAKYANSVEETGEAV